MRVIDLSVPIEEGPSEMTEPKIGRENHSAGSQIMQAIFQCAEKDLPGGLGWANDHITLMTHTGTHLDAPYHFSPTSEGKPARTIDQVPLEWCFSDGFVLDMRHKADGARIEAADVEQALKKINYVVKPFDIALIMTGADKYWGSPEYGNKGCGMGREATLWLIDKGVKIMGIDAWGFDRPFVHIAEEFGQTGDSKIIWEAHFAGIEREYCHIEKLANLDLLPPSGFKVACFPVKITGASAGWTRAVALAP
ncbi:MAG: cyclase family protein [Candidatus Abyssobacteria bacterium SURF_5]|uniref:Cyclase family protein n=1 Tax=Abyssobacteria bacterium (strain SURF_5) TaxID=2093360 RepID=A0A3A4NAI0_ABYX5|nr:MAG: cyclase family protein [Candidatus Abyssubacteria bacterium SURF_5]